MRFLIDADLPRTLVPLFASFGYEVFSLLETSVKPAVIVGQEFRGTLKRELRKGVR